jgi:hypothetical protein
VDVWSLGMGIEKLESFGFRLGKLFALDECTDPPDLGCDRVPLYMLIEIDVDFHHSLMAFRMPHYNGDWPYAKSKAPAAVKQQGPLVGNRSLGMRSRTNQP